MAVGIVTTEEVSIGLYFGKAEHGGKLGLRGDGKVGEQAEANFSPAGAGLLPWVFTDDGDELLGDDERSVLRIARDGDQCATERVDG